MQSRELHGRDERAFVLVFDENEEAAAGLLDFCKQEELTAAHFTAIGALREVDLGWFNIETREYEKNTLKEQVEVLSLVGNVAVYDGKPKVHAHLVVGKRDGTAHGGHLLRGIVRPTLEVMIEESAEHLKRKMDEKTGLPLLDPDAATQPHRRGRELKAETTS